VAGTTPADPPPSNLFISNFADGMGVVYNGLTNGNTPSPIFVFFDQPQLAVGAYISSEVLGGFTATITLFDISGQPVGSFPADGNASDQSGNALFIGAASLSDPVYAAEFTATGSGADLATLLLSRILQSGRCGWAWAT
jgi:hypothetical protein